MPENPSESFFDFSDEQGVDAVSPSAFRCRSIRPRVRYVDRERAVVETVIESRCPLATNRPVDLTADVTLRIHGDDGFEDEVTRRVQTRDGRASVTVELVWPRRWWPANLGPQALYTVAVAVGVEGVMLDARTHTIGLTSVRSADAGGGAGARSMLVNGQPFEVSTVVHVDSADAARLLPAGSDALLVVRDHYATSGFFDATDRAGILAVQCVPLSADGTPEADVAGQVEALATHPSLIGWYVGHHGAAADGLAAGIRRLDPTRPVYRELPAA